MKNGNEYVLLKPYTTEDGKKLHAGSICQCSDGILFAFDETRTYVKFDGSLVPEESIALYNEAPVNKELRERRERIATAVMQGIINGMVENHMMMEQMQRRASKDGYEYLSDMIASDAIGYAESLIKKLDETSY